MQPRQLLLVKHAFVCFECRLPAFCSPHCLHFHFRIECTRVIPKCHLGTWEWTLHITTNIPMHGQPMWCYFVTRKRDDWPKCKTPCTSNAIASPVALSVKVTSTSTPLPVEALVRDDLPVPSAACGPPSQLARLSHRRHTHHSCGRHLPYKPHDDKKSQKQNQPKLIKVNNEDLTKNKRHTIYRGVLMCLRIIHSTGQLCPCVHGACVVRKRKK